jgi:hypothetical protein
VGDRVLAAKGDPGAVVMLSILDPSASARSDLRARQEVPVPHGCGQRPGLVDAFEAATDLVETACAEFIPG